MKYYYESLGESYWLTVIRYDSETTKKQFNSYLSFFYSLVKDLKLGNDVYFNGERL